MTKYDADRMQEIIRRLNEASEAYYGGRDEIMSNFEWDALFDELSRLEEETGVILPDSPTQKVNTAAEDNIAGEKEAHEFPALSLAKTKKIEDLQEWAGNRPVWLSWKLDGLTLVLTYDGGKLSKILTRGNGTVGTNITFMKSALYGFPLKIADHGHLVVRGEATISYPEFEKNNATFSDPAERFANPRGMVNSMLALDAKRLDEVLQRNITFNAFTLIYSEREIVSWGARMDYLDRLGFTTVERELTDAGRLPETVAEWTRRVESGEMQIPVDGLVINYDDTLYAATGSVTGHHAMRAGYAFKWQDEVAKTTLRQIDWVSEATTITPVAIFDPVQLEGTTVSRASLVNLSEMDRLGIGENGKTEIRVIKSNKIIPKVVGVIKAVGKYALPERCPACEGPVSIATGPRGVRMLKCDNPECPAKKLEKPENPLNDGRCAGLTFVITGEVYCFKNRDAFKAYVEENGGKVAGSVSKKTDFLVNNDLESSSSKNMKARELGIPILSEDDFIARFIDSDDIESAIVNKFQEIDSDEGLRYATGKSRARLEPYDPRKWGITFAEYNKLADAVEQNILWYEGMANKNKFSFKRGYESVDEYVNGWKGTKDFTTASKPKRDSVTQMEFEDIVRMVLCSEDFKNSVLEYKINDKEIWVKVGGKRRGCPWAFRLSFDDNGKITGDYKLTFATYETANIWRNIGARIHNRIKSACYLSVLNNELMDMLWR